MCDKIISFFYVFVGDESKGLVRNSPRRPVRTVSDLLRFFHVSLTGLGLYPYGPSPGGVVLCVYLFCGHTTRVGTAGEGIPTE